VTPAVGHLEGSVFVFPMRVYYEDTDAAGIVYFANYLKFAERARTEYLRALGIDQIDLRRERGIFFAVHRVEIDYLKPAKLDDLVDVTAELVFMNHVRFDAEQTVRRGTELLARMFTRVVCLSTEGRPARLPRDLHELFLPLVRPERDKPRQDALAESGIRQPAAQAAQTAKRG
jgi:acyl-CoA thioester hydrolase